MYRICAPITMCFRCCVRVRQSGRTSASCVTSARMPVPTCGLQFVRFPHRNVRIIILRGSLDYKYYADCFTVLCWLASMSFSPNDTCTLRLERVAGAGRKAEKAGRRIPISPAVYGYCVSEAIACVHRVKKRQHITQN